MLPSKISIAKEPAGILRALAQRARLTPNLLARMALATSLELGPVGPTGHGGDSGGQEFNLYTLLGADQDLYLALVEVVEGDPAAAAGEAELAGWLVAHIERGIPQLAVRVKSPGDVARLMATAG